MSASKCRDELCRNKTTNPTGYCYAHEHLSMGVTPLGQYATRHFSGLDLKMKLAKEFYTPIPEDSACIPGYPYFTRTDLTAYKYFIQTGDERYRPTTEIITDRFPVVIREIDGSAVTGQEVGIYGGEKDELHTFNQAIPTNQRSANINEQIRIFVTEAGDNFSVQNSRKYQVVYIDEQTIVSL